MYYLNTHFFVFSSKRTVHCLTDFKQAFESTLKSWEDKQKCDSGKPVLRTHLYIQHAADLATEEVSQMQLCSQAAEELITRYPSPASPAAWPVLLSVV